MTLSRMLFFFNHTFILSLSCCKLIKRVLSRSSTCGIKKTLTLSAKSRGFHLVTDEILNQLADMPRVNIGLLHLLLQHTSASLTLNENCDPTVRHDMERFFPPHRSRQRKL